MPTASIKFTPDFLTISYKRYRRQFFSRFIGLFARLLLFALLALVAALVFWLDNISWGITLAVLSVFALFSHHLDYWLARRSFRKSPYYNEEIKIDLTEEGYHTHSPKQDTKLQWSVFTKAVHFKDGILFFQGPKVCSWIPFSSLDDLSMVAELQALVQSKITNHIIVEQHTAGE